MRVDHKFNITLIILMRYIELMAQFIVSKDYCLLAKALHTLYLE